MLLANKDSFSFEKKKAKGGKEGESGREGGRERRKGEESGTCPPLSLL